MTPNQLLSICKQGRRDFTNTESFNNMKDRVDTFLGRCLNATRDRSEIMAINWSKGRINEAYNVAPMTLDIATKVIRVADRCGIHFPGEVAMGGGGENPVAGVANRGPFYGVYNDLMNPVGGQGRATQARALSDRLGVSVPAVRLLSFMLHDTKSRPYDHTAIVSQIGGYVFWKNAVNELTREGYIVQAGQTYRVNNAELKEHLR